MVKKRYYKNFKLFWGSYPLYPELDDALIKHLLTYPGEFERIITNTIDLVSLIRSNTKYTDALLKHTLKYPGEFQRLIQNLTDFIWLCESFPEYIKSFVNHIVSDTKEFVRLINIHAHLST